MGNCRISEQIQIWNIKAEQMDAPAFVYFCRMSIFSIPESLVTPAPDLLLHHYRSQAERNLKSQISITRPLFSFLLEGEKQVHFREASVSCSPDKALVFSSGHCLMTERAMQGGHYSSLLFFFAESPLAALREKHPHLFARKPTGPRRAGFILDQDDFIRPFVASLLQLTKTTLAGSLLPLKFEELMVYLAYTYPETFPDFVAGLDEGGADGLLRRVVEHNIYSNLTLEELAFLCHMSQSTFKRKFEHLFGMPPIRWFQEQRMRRAARLLQQGRKASEIYEELGYRTLSSFVQAFKKEFGVPPRAWQEELTF
jgi:AraC-like DNA-binding protein